MHQTIYTLHLLVEITCVVGDVSNEGQLAQPVNGRQQNFQWFEQTGNSLNNICWILRLVYIWFQAPQSLTNQIENKRFRSRTCFVYYNLIIRKKDPWFLHLKNNFIEILVNLNLVFKKVSYLKPIKWTTNQLIQERKKLHRKFIS